MLTEIANGNEPYLRGAAERGLAQLQALDGIDQLTGLVREYWAVTGRPPSSWNDLRRAGLLPGVPADTTGEPFLYDPKTQKATLSPESSLAPLPRSFGAQ
jgi:hypothetical protein